VPQRPSVVGCHIIGLADIWYDFKELEIWFHCLGKNRILM